MRLAVTTHHVQYQYAVSGRCCDLVHARACMQPAGDDTCGLSLGGRGLPLTQLDCVAAARLAVADELARVFRGWGLASVRIRRQQHFTYIC